MPRRLIFAAMPIEKLRNEPLRLFFRRTQRRIVRNRCCECSLSSSTSSISREQVFRGGLSGSTTREQFACFSVDSSGLQANHEERASSRNRPCCRPRLFREAPPRVARWSCYRTSAPSQQDRLQRLSDGRSLEVVERFQFDFNSSRRKPGSLVSPPGRDPQTRLREEVHRARSHRCCAAMLCKNADGSYGA